MTIHKAILKHGYSNFKVEILEFCSKEEVLAREQYYLDLLKPSYNILVRAGSSLGFTHSEETIAKFKETRKNKVYSEEEKARVSKMNLLRSEELRQKDRERVLEWNVAKSFPIEVTNVVTGQKTVYPSIRQGASELGAAHTSVRQALKSKSLLKKTYKITYVNK